MGNHGPGTLTVAVEWDEFVLDDLDVVLERRLPDGMWIEADNDVGNNFLDSPPGSFATVELVNAPAGQYRTRVVN